METISRTSTGGLHFDLCSLWRDTDVP